MANTNRNSDGESWIVRNTSGFAWKLVSVTILGIIIPLISFVYLMQDRRIGRVEQDVSAIRMDVQIGKEQNARVDEKLIYISQQLSDIKTLIKGP